MDFLLGLLSSGIFVPIIIGVIVVLAFFLMFYRVADANEALVITGWSCGEGKVKIGGGCVVIPLVQRSRRFPLDILTITEDGDEVRTKQGVPIIIRWTAQAAIITHVVDEEGKVTKEIEPNLIQTIRYFLAVGDEGLCGSIKNTIQANVRETIAAMTPESVLSEKKVFVENIIGSTIPDLRSLGITIRTLNINEVCDNLGYFDNMAQGQIQEKRREAEVAKAEAEQAIREKKADTDRAAQEKELAAEIAVAEKTRDNQLKIEGFRVETDTRKADADIAGDLQKQIRTVELNERTGQALAKEMELKNTIAKQENEVQETKALQAVIVAKGKANAEAEEKKINAAAQAEVDKIKADGQAEAKRREALGVADAIKMEAAAEKQRIQDVGTAEADVIKAKGLAEAEAIEAKGLAEAKAQNEMAKALAAQDGVNLKVELAQIEAKARVEIATNAATLMANVGTTAKFVNIGGAGQGDAKTGNVLIDTLQGLGGVIPGLLEKGNAVSEVLNGGTLPSNITDLIKGFMGQGSTEVKNEKEFNERAEVLDELDELDDTQKVLKAYVEGEDVDEDELKIE